MASALVVGSIALDSIETPHGRVLDALGGSAAYGSVAASYFAPVGVVAVVGRDFPTKYTRKLQARGIDLGGVEHRDGRTFRWSGYYERSMGQAHTNTTELNVFEHFNPTLTSAQRKARFVFLANIHPELQYSALKQMDGPELVAIDTMNYWIEGHKQALTQVIKKANLLLMNEEEARQYCETPNLIAAAKGLLKLGPRAVVIKKGEHGAMIFTRQRIMTVPAFPLAKLKDPTGAGDTFAGTLVGYVARLGRATDDNILRAILVGSVMASFVVEDFSLNRLLRVKAAEINKRADHIRAMMALPAIDRKSLAPMSR